MEKEIKFAIYSIPARNGKLETWNNICLLPLKAVLSDMEAGLQVLNYSVYKMDRDRSPQGRGLSRV